MLAKGALRLLAVACWLCSSGCGVVFQTLYGWNSEVERESTRTYPVTIRTQPESALVTRMDPEGQVELGPSPALDQVGLPVRETVRVPEGTMPLLIGGLVDGLVTLGAARGFAVNARRPDDDSQGAAVLFFEIMVLSAAACFAELVFAGIYANFEPSVVRSEPIEPERKVAYLVERPGYKGMMGLVRVPWEDKAELRLVPASTSTAPSGIPGLGRPGADPCAPPHCAEAEPGGLRLSETSSTSRD